MSAATSEPAAPRSASSLFGVTIDLGTPPQMIETIAGWAAQGSPRRVMYANAHVVNLAQSQPELRAALRRADLVYCDGYGVRLAARLLDREVPHRMTGADWIWDLATLCRERSLSLYLLGSEPPRAIQAAERLRTLYPGLRVTGAHHGFFAVGSPHSERVLEDIAAHAPDIVLVGMGTPKQELWADAFGPQLNGPVVWTVGALFDYVSGHIPRAPHWLADNGLEWIFRLMVEPGRMWRRYLIGNPEFLARVVAELRRRDAAG